MLFTVAIDRFLAIKAPFTYERLMTINVTITINIVLWLLSFAFGVLPLYYWNSDQRELEYSRFTEVLTFEFLIFFQFFGLTLVSLVITIGIYIYIFKIIRHHTNQMQALYMKFRLKIDFQEDLTFDKDVRNAKVFALLVLAFTVG